VPPAPGPDTTPPASGGGVSGVRVTGQALAAVTTATVGGFLGGASGTVAGAAVASIVTTVGEALYQRSLERTRDRVRTRIDAHRTRGPGPGGAATALVGQGSADATRVAAAPAGTRVLPAGELDDPGPDETPTVVLTETTAPPARTGHGRQIAVLAATGVVIFLIAMVVVTGIERVKGSPLSGGEGTSVGEVFGTHAPTTTAGAADGDDGETTTARATTSQPRTSTRTTTTRPTVTTTRSRGAPGTTPVTPTP
jgi:hypothetical protein